MIQSKRKMNRPSKIDPISGGSTTTSHSNCTNLSNFLNNTTSSFYDKLSTLIPILYRDYTQTDDISYNLNELYNLDNLDDTLDLYNQSNVNSSNQTISKLSTYFSTSSSSFTISPPNPKDYPIDYPTFFPQVSILTNREIKTIPKSSFVWLEKTDGIRHILLIENNNFYQIHNFTLTYLFTIPNEPNFKSRSILDTEKLNDKFYIFDISYCMGEDISTLHFIERMDFLDKLLPSTNSTNSILIPKSYKPISNWEELITFTNQYISPETNNIIDGVICQRTDLPYYSTSPACYKLKRPVMNTTDFLLKYWPEQKAYRLYLCGSLYALSHSISFITRHNNFSLDDVGYSLWEYLKNPDSAPYPINFQFHSPYTINSHVLILREKWDTTGYLKPNIDEINSIMHDMISKPMDYNNCIVELSLANDGWVPMRVRKDKIKPNGYNVGLTNCGVIFAPINLNDSYFVSKDNVNNNIKPELIDAYHNVNKLIRTHIIEHSISSHKFIKSEHNLLSCIDLAGGRGADEFNLYHSGVSNIIAVDSDKEALVQYVNRTQYMYKLKYTSPFGNPDKRKEPLYLNARHAILGKDNSSIIDEIKNIHEFNIVKDEKGGFDIVLMNFAIHYLCYDKKCLKELARLFKELCNKQAIFIFSFFDGDEIISKFKNDAVELGNDGVFRIERVNNDVGDKEYNVKSNNDAIWAKMPLPTIDKTGYRIEPLVQKKWLEEMVSESGLKVLKKFNGIDGRIIPMVNKVENKDMVVDYLNLIRVWVVGK